VLTTRIRLFRNTGHGTFERAASNQVGSIVIDGNDWNEASWTDIDNDGWPDVFVGAWAGAPALYRNDTRGGFTRIMDCGLPLSAPGHCEGVVWADYDNDGFVDVYYGVGENLARSTLYRNNGAGRFIGVSEGPLSLNPAGWLEGASWTDYNNDGLMDLVVTYPPFEGGAGVLHYQNEGGGVFVEVTTGALREVSGNVISHVWGDYDNDGLQDVFIGRISNTSLLLHNDGGDAFHQTSVALGSAFAGNWGDYDNDGDLDLLVCLQNIGTDLFQNNGDGSFTRMNSFPLIGQGSSTGQPTWGQAAWGDYDNDGFLDVVLTPDAYIRTNAFLYHNNTNANHWLMFKLEGAVANRMALGAKVRVQATIGGRSTWQVRELTRPYRAHDDLRPHFGLGDATNAEVVRIEWPSGQVTEMRDVAANRILTITEPPAIRPVSAAPAGAFQFELKSHRGMVWDLYASDHVHFSAETCACSNGYWKADQCVTNTTGTVVVTDTNVQGAAARFYKVEARSM